MDSNFTAPFIAATIRTLKDMCGVEAKLEYQGPRQKTTKRPVEIAGTIGITGKQFQGAMIVSFPKATFLSLMGRMLGTRLTEITPELEDGAAELANIIFGGAKPVLNKAGHEIAMAIPTILRGNQFEAAISGDLLGDTLVFSTFSGPLYIEFAGREIAPAPMPAVTNGNKELPKLDAHVFISFVEGVRKTMETQGGEKVTSGVPFQKAKNGFTFDVGGQIGITGSVFSGTFAIYFDSAAFLEMVRRLTGEKHAEVTQEIEDAATEIVNIVFGTAKTVLNQEGYALRTAIPTIVRGSQMQAVHVSSRRPPLVLPFSGFGGNFWVEFGFETNKA